VITVYAKSWHKMEYEINSRQLLARQ